MKAPGAVLLFASLAAATTADAQVLTRRDLHPPIKREKREQPRQRVPPAAEAPETLTAANTMVFSPATVTLVAGEGANVKLQVTSTNGYAGPVTLSASIAPAAAGIAVQFAPESATLAAGQTATVSMVIFTLRSVSPGDYTVTVKGSAANGDSMATLPLGVQAASQDLFSQGSIQFTSTDGSKPAVAVQALDLYFGNNDAGVVSIRATFPTASAAPASGLSTAAPNQNLRSQMLDSFGGILNVTGGWQGSPLKNVTSLTVDLRGGLKLVEVPEDVARSTTEGYTQSPFFTALAKINYAAQGEGQGHKAILILTGSYFFNAVPEKEVAARFTTALNRVSQGANASMSLSVPDLHFYVVGQFRWSSDKQVGHQFVFSFNPAK